MSRQESFEKEYAEAHGLPLETFAQYRMGDTYRQPMIAKCWRFWNKAIDTEECKRTVTMDVFFQQGDEPFVCAIRGKMCLYQLQLAEKDFRENLPDILEKGDGIYTFEFFHERGQYDEWGRCEIAEGWGFDFVKYTAFETELEMAQ